ncbi:hypothetical protein DFH09DRAFT_1108592 [Mycena vulgaris]|nr:hypothetical protein DFH09DRAFT_1108592 [Mycena vulgaris]
MTPLSLQEALPFFCIGAPRLHNPKLHKIVSSTLELVLRARDKYSQSKPDHPTLTPLLRQRAALAWSPGWRSRMRPLVITSLLPYFVFVDSSTCNASGRPLNAKTVAAEARGQRVRGERARPATPVLTTSGFPRRARASTFITRARSNQPHWNEQARKDNKELKSQSIVDTERSERRQNPERRAAGLSGAGARAGWKLVDGTGAGRERERERAGRV